MTKIVSDTRRKVKTFLKDIYGKNYQDIVQEIDDSFVVRRGSAAVHVRVKPLSKDDCMVQAVAYVVQGAKIGPKLLGYLMRMNATMPIGAYGLLFDDTIVFSHSIAGAHLDRNELRTTVATVAFVADESDDDIRRMAGGLRAVDAAAVVLGHDGDTSITKAASGKSAAKKPAVNKKAPAAAAAKKKVPAKAAAKKGTGK